MKIKSIITLGILLSFSQVVMADKSEDTPDAEQFKQAKAQMLQGASKQIEVLSKFKSCVETAATIKDLAVCRKDKQKAFKAFKNKKKKENSKKPKNAKEPKSAE